MSHKATTAIDKFHVVTLLTTVAAAVVLALLSVYVAVTFGAPAALGWVVLAGAGGLYARHKLVDMRSSGSPRHARSSAISN
jgi:hypothetical protein